MAAASTRMVPQGKRGAAGTVRTPAMPVVAAEPTPSWDFSSCTERGLAKGNPA